MIGDDGDYDPLADNPVDKEPEAGDAPNASNKRGVKNAERLQKEKVKRLDNVTRQLLALEDGREYLSWLVFDICGLLRPVGNGSYDSNAAYYRAGQIDIGQAFLKHMLALNPAGVAEMIVKHSGEVKK